MLVGLLVAAVALGIAILVAGLKGSWRSPVVTIGESVVDRVPSWVKTFAVRTFGSNDKLALQIGTVAILAVFAVVIGLVARRRPRLAAGGVALFGLVGAASAVSRPAASWTSAIPSIVGAAAGIGALVVLRARLLLDAPAGSMAGTAAGLDPDRVGLPPGRPVGRRQLLLTSAAAVAVAAVAGGAGQALRSRFSVAGRRAQVALPPPTGPTAAPLPADPLGVPGITPFMTSNADFYRVDTALVVPQVDPDTWTLRIHGMVDKELNLSYQDLLDRQLVEKDLTMVCVSNEIGGTLAGTARWLGFPLAALLDEAGVQPGADQVVSRSVDGWNCGTPTAVIMDGRDALVAVGMNGEPLPLEHGFPARLVVPGLYGYVSATKWLSEIELTTMDAFDGYWVKRSWAKEGPIKTFSRIDTPKGLSRTAAGPAMIGGMAWHPHVGISAVEVRIDDGAWQPATLAPVPSDDLWVQWALPWDATSGRHQITVRATDGDGVVQTEDRAAPIPDGASGWHSVVALVA